MKTISMLIAMLLVAFPALAQEQRSYKSSGLSLLGGRKSISVSYSKFQRWPLNKFCIICVKDTESREPKQCLTYRYNTKTRDLYEVSRFGQY